MTPVITVRALGTGYEPVYGTGSSSFLVDLAAVAQIIRTRILLFAGEWWESITDGTPMFQSILGNSGSPDNANVISSLIQQRILGTAYVVSLSSVVSLFNAAARSYSFSCQVLTRFGTLLISSTPTASSATLFNS